MRHTCFENSIPLDVCKYIKKFFDDNPDLQIHKSNNPDVVKINKPWKHLHEVLDPILSKYFKTNKGQGGNIYKHKKPKEKYKKVSVIDLADKFPNGFFNERLDEVFQYITKKQEETESRMLLRAASVFRDEIC